MQGKSEVFDRESLIFVKLGARQMLRAVWQVEGIAVLVEYGDIFGEERGEPAGGLRRACGFEGRPADLGATRDPG